MARNAVVALATSAKTIHACKSTGGVYGTVRVNQSCKRWQVAGARCAHTCPLNRVVFSATISNILPYGANAAYSAFFRAAFLTLSFKLLM